MTEDNRKGRKISSRFSDSAHRIPTDDKRSTSQAGNSMPRTNGSANPSEGRSRSGSPGTTPPHAEARQMRQGGQARREATGGTDRTQAGGRAQQPRRSTGTANMRRGDATAHQRDTVRVRRTGEPRPMPKAGTARPAASNVAQARQRQIERRELDRLREQRRQERIAKRNAGPIGFHFSHRRVVVLSAIVMVIALVFVGRLAQVQIVQGAELAARAKALRTTSIVLTATRGDILDRNGQALATSVTRYKIFADQELIEAWKKRDQDGNIEGEGPRYAAHLLAPVINVDEDKLTELLTKDPEQKKYNKYVTLAKEVPTETWNAVKELRITGVFPETLNKRIYPSGDTAKNLIGAVGQDGGLSGLEYTLNKQLEGKDGKSTYERSLDGYILPAGDVTTQESVAGSNITTTIDSDIQWHAEQALDARIKAFGASAGTVLVQDVHTCEILALADRSTTKDGNTATTGRIGAVQDVFEPGSTAKIITMSAAIETGKATPTSQFKVPYKYTTPNGQTFQDSHMHATEKMTLTGILADSSNTGSVEVGSLMTKQVRYDYLKKFGFGEKTGIELGGETRGILHPVEQWDGRTQYGVLFGQGVAANALQATNVFAVVANGGKMCQPHLVKGITDAQGVFTPSDKSKLKEVVSKKTADQVLSMMESVVVDGSGKAGAIDGYRVGGKTGTAQAAGTDGKLSSYVSSFIGVAPIDNPQIVVSVIIRDPKAAIYGAEVSAPVFADVMSYSLQRLNIEPSITKPKLFPTRWGE